MIKCLFLIITLLCISNAVNPGVKVAISRSGLDYAARKVVDKMAQKIPKMRFSDVSGSSYRLYNMRLSSFTKPRPTISTTNSLSISLNGGAARVDGNWYVRFWFFRKSGSFYASTGMNLQMRVAITESSGRPRFVAQGCSASLPGFRVRASGGIIGWLLNILARVLNSRIRRLVENSMCAKLIESINNDANNELSSLNLIARVNNHIQLDYRLTGPVQFYSTYMASSHKGKFLFDPQTTFNPYPMGFFMSRMVSTSISEETFNSLGRVLHSRNLLSYSYSFNNDFLGQIFNDSSNSNIVISMRTVSPPTTTIRNTGLKVNGVMDVEFRFRNDLLLKLRVSVTTNTILSISGERLRGTLSNLQLNVALLNNNLGVPLRSSTINAYAQQLVPSVLPPINSKLSEGLPLPKTRSLTFTGYRLNLAYKTLQMAFNVV